jgi:hypothetical protein
MKELWNVGKRVRKVANAILDLLILPICPPICLKRVRKVANAIPSIAFVTFRTRLKHIGAARNIGWAMRSSRFSEFPKTLESKIQNTAGP